jgi:hypothetical protein
VAKPKPAMNACETASANAWAVAWSECCSARPNRRLAMGAAPVQGLPSPAPSRSGLQQMTLGRGCNQPRPTVNSWNADHFVSRLQSVLLVRRASAFASRRRPCLCGMSSLKMLWPESPFGG